MSDSQQSDNIQKFSDMMYGDEASNLSEAQKAELKGSAQVVSQGLNNLDLGTSLENGIARRQEVLDAIESPSQGMTGGANLLSAGKTR